MTDGLLGVVFEDEQFEVSSFEVAEVLATALGLILEELRYSVNTVHCGAFNGRS